MPEKQNGCPSKTRPVDTTTNLQGAESKNSCRSVQSPGYVWKKLKVHFAYDGRLHKIRQTGCSAKQGSQYHCQHHIFSLDLSFRNSSRGHHGPRQGVLQPNLYEKPVGSRKSFDYLHKNTKLAAKYKGPFQIVRVLPHNNVEIRLSARRKSIVHANKLKPYHSKEEFQTFEDYFPDQTFDFKKQGGEENPDNYFNEEKDFTENNFESPEEQKFEEEKEESENTEEITPPKRGRGRPRKTEKKTFKDIDERYQMRSRKREGNTKQDQDEESESKNQEREEWTKQ
jgi:hypothetical protein